MIRSLQIPLRVGVFVRHPYDEGSRQFLIVGDAAIARHTCGKSD